MKTRNTKPVNEVPKIIPRHKDTLMGLPIVLINAAYEAVHGDETGVVVPDIPALEAAIAVARASVPTKLSGNEIRFLRKAIGMKAQDLAKFLDVTPETFSRWENDSGSPISTNPERVFRLRVVHALRDKTPGVMAKDDVILDMNFVPFRTTLNPVTLVFYRLAILQDGCPQQVWHFIGTEAEETRKRLRVVA